MPSPTAAKKPNTGAASALGASAGSIVSRGTKRTRAVAATKDEITSKSGAPSFGSPTTSTIVGSHGTLTSDDRAQTLSSIGSAGTTPMQQLMASDPLMAKLVNARPALHMINAVLTAASANTPAPSPTAGKRIKSEVVPSSDTSLLRQNYLAQRAAATYLSNNDPTPEAAQAFWTAYQAIAGPVTFSGGEVIAARPPSMPVLPPVTARRTLSVATGNLAVNKAMMPPPKGTPQSRTGAHTQHAPAAMPQHQSVVDHMMTMPMFDHDGAFEHTSDSGSLFGSRPIADSTWAYPFDLPSLSDNISVGSMNSLQLADQQTGSSSSLADFEFLAAEVASSHPRPSGSNATGNVLASQYRAPITGTTVSSPALDTTKVSASCHCSCIV